MSALIIGGGIGGLSAAIGLARAGVEARVFEQAGEIREIGSGIGLFANGIQALDHLGVSLSALSDVHWIKRAAVYNHLGRMLFHIPESATPRGMPGLAVVVYRPELVQVLADTVGPDHITLGHRFLSVSQDGDRVTAAFESRANATGDILIGADGIHSQVRLSLRPSATPRYLGISAWRGYAAIALDLPSDQGIEWWGPGAAFGLHPSGGGHTYWYASLLQDADQPRALTELLQIFSDWPEPVPNVIAETSEADVVWTDLYECPLQLRWTDDRIALLGDAAHAMSPYLGQGGAQALEDSSLLATCVRQHGLTPHALRSYERQRQLRALSIQWQSRGWGRLMHARHPLFTTVRDALLRLVPSPARAAVLRRKITSRLP